MKNFCLAFCILFTFSIKAQRIEDGDTYALLALHSGKAIDVGGASQNENSPVVQYGYEGAANQKWMFYKVSGKFYKLIASHSGKSLSATSLMKGSGIVQNTFKNEDAQLWDIVPGIEGSFQLINKTGLVLAVGGSNMDDGGNLLLWENNKGSEQHWMMHKIEPINLVNESKIMVKEMLPSIINDPGTIEDYPLISPDNKTLYYRRFTNGQTTSDVGSQSDIWFVKGDKNGKWLTPEKAPSQFQSDMADCTLSITPDGQQMLILHDGQTKLVTQRAGEWLTPEKLVIDNYYNRSPWNEFSVSASGKILMMTLKRDDSKSASLTRDIYVSFLKENGSWTEPKPLGNTVNTFGDEATPFLAPDENTLYFSSKGHSGYGGCDVFVSRRLDDTWQKWSTPENLGPIVNSNLWDGCFSIAANGEYGYMSTGGDIARFKMSASSKPEPSVLISGKVYNLKTKELIAAKITYELLPGGENVGNAFSAADTGYKIILPKGHQYAFMAKADGFISQSDNMDLTTLQSYEEITRDLYLAPLEIGAPIALTNVFFEQSKDVLISSSYPELERLVKMLKENPSINIELQGHTDNAGMVKDNLALSENRTKKVESYLIEKGINKSRITSKGFGGSKPIVPNTNEANRKKNRRVEFVIMKK